MTEISIVATYGEWDSQKQTSEMMEISGFWLGVVIWNIYNIIKFKS